MSVSCSGGGSSPSSSWGKKDDKPHPQKRDFGGVLLYDIEKERFEKVFRKLAFGYLAYENDTLAWDIPYSICAKKLNLQPFKTAFLNYSLVKKQKFILFALGFN